MAGPVRPASPGLPQKNARKPGTVKNEGKLVSLRESASWTYLRGLRCFVSDGLRPELTQS